NPRALNAHEFSYRAARLLLTRGRLRQLQVLPIRRPAEQFVLNDVDRLGHLELVRRVQLGQVEELAGRVGRRLPAVGLSLGHARGDDPLAVGWYRLGLLVRGRPRGRAHRGGHANGRDQLEGIPSRRVVHRSISSRSTNEIQNNRRLQRIESVTWSGPTG